MTKARRLRRSVVVGVVAVALLVGGIAAVRHFRTVFPPDHGYSALVEWRPRQGAFFECLIESIKEEPARFKASRPFVLLPPEDERSSITLKTSISTRRLQLAERSVVMRGYNDSQIVRLDC